MASSREWGCGSYLEEIITLNLHKRAAPHLRLCMKKSSCPKNSWQLCWRGILFYINYL